MLNIVETLNAYDSTQEHNVRLTVFQLKMAARIEKEIRIALPKSKITVVEDLNLGGGYTIQIGEHLIDDSHVTKLKQLQTTLENTSADSIADLRKAIVSSSLDFTPEVTEAEIGVVESVKDGICKINGLKGCMHQELLNFTDEIKGIAFNLEEDFVGAIILGDFSQITTGQIVKRSGNVISVPVGEALLGRVVNPLGEALDNGPTLNCEKTYPIERTAPGILARKPVTIPLQTGIKAIDALIPIGRGQRELILGDRQTGKTTIAIDTILNQKDSGVICIYVAIGQKESKIAKLVERLREREALEYTIIVNASASQPSPMLFLAPYAGTAIAEYFVDQGKDVLIVYDDLTKHAIAYREMSLLLRRPPGREAYPGDVFYLHSRLLERSCRLNDELGGGSITSLPIIETQAGDISAYIPTNVISITDGQIFLENELFYKGLRPAINVGLSVSRVGSAAQLKTMKKVAGTLKITLAQFRELEEFSQFSSDLDSTTKSLLEKGRRIIEVLKQEPTQPVKFSDQVVILYAVNNGYLDNYELAKLKKVEKDLQSYANMTALDLMHSLSSGEWSEEIEQQLKDVCHSFVENYKVYVQQQ